MRAARFAFLLALAACGDDSNSSGADDGLPLDGEVHDPALTAPVHVARDKYGVAHIGGETTGDVAYAQRYVMAHDRLPQIDIPRRFGAGTLAIAETHFDAPYSTAEIVDNGEARWEFKR